MSRVRVRFAPSPTGYLHIGGLRTAFYDYLFARNQSGDLILRIEDTDQNRLVAGAADSLISSLHTLGIEFDEGPGIGGQYGPYVQSARLDTYRQYADELLHKGFAYPCFCSSERLDDLRKDLQEKKLFPKYDRHCVHIDKAELDHRIAAGEKYVLRLKMPDERIFAFDDLIRGRVEIDTSQLDDQVIIKSDGFPTYHLAAVVDDHLMQISHVIRGEEWLSSTPKHIFLYECFGWTPPLWVHLPLILNPDRSKLSKRMNDVSVESYLQKGYLKEALLNFIALLGWHGSDDIELYTVPELVREFSFARVNKAGAIFDLTKLDWMNGQYIRSLPLDYIAEKCKPHFIAAGIDISDADKFLRVVETARGYITVLPEVIDHARMYYQTGVIETQEMAIMQSDSSKQVFSYYIQALNTLPEWEKPAFTELVKTGMTELGIKGKNYFHPLRLALFYQGSGPDIPTLLHILGRAETLSRLKAALEL